MTLPFMSAPEVAEMFDVDDETVRRWCDAGELSAQFERGVWFIDRDSVDRMRDGFDERNERIAQERHTSFIKNIVDVSADCPHCGRTIRNLGALGRHRIACARKAARLRRWELVRQAHARAEGR